MMATPPTRREPEHEDAERIARGLGWFSYGLGLVQIGLPGALSRIIGVPDTGRSRALQRAVGLREVSAGTGIFARPRAAEWLWARVAGDVMDLGLLGAALTSPRARKGQIAGASAAVVGLAVLDVYSARKLSARGGGVPVERAITIHRSPEDVYGFWRDFANLPRFMGHLESVEETGDRRSHWTAKAPAGRSVSWDAEVVEDRPNEVIAWRSLDGADVDNAGTVRFTPAPGGRGTEVHVSLRYDPPAGGLGAAVAKLFGEEPARQVRDDLFRLKQVLETGEVVRSEGSPDGPRLRQRPAQPMGSADGA